MNMCGELKKCSQTELTNRVLLNKEVLSGAKLSIRPVLSLIRMKYTFKHKVIAKFLSITTRKTKRIDI